MNNQIINNDVIENSDEEHNINNIFISSESPKQKQLTPAIEINKNHITDDEFDVKSDDSTRSGSSIINGWDNEATNTLDNWYEAFTRQSYIYQYILDRNRKISDNLNLISVISSSSLGIFSAFKLWIQDDNKFQVASNVLMMFFNFIIAIITATSRRYLDDKKNEEIRTYIEEVDKFLGQLSAQYLKAHVYRLDADEFFKSFNDTYTKLISSAPNLSLNELDLGHKKYIIYKENMKKYNCNSV